MICPIFNDPISIQESDYPNPMMATPAEKSSKKRKFSYATVFEAVVGAIVIEYGVDFSNRFLHRHFARWPRHPGQAIGL
ncbi:MAG: hypothetical protein MZU97_23005 [Bacillus subtilis]|nr:hypothetical protein [Bacillus subtilis]